MKSSPHWLYLTCVLFFFLIFYLRCRRLLTQLVLRVSRRVTCAFCMALGSVLHFSTAAKKVGERWLTSSEISNDVDGKPCSRCPRGNRSHVKCFQWSSRVKERSWVLIQMKDPLRIILHFIAFCIAFYCQLDLQWENYTMLVFCFIMLLFLIFQNIRNFILLYVMAEKYFLPRSIRISLQKQTNPISNWCSLSFPLFWYTCGWETPINNL